MAITNTTERMSEKRPIKQMYGIALAMLGNAT